MAPTDEACMRPPSDACSGRGVGTVHNHKRVAMDHRTVIATAELRRQVAGAATQQGWKLPGVVVHQAAGNHDPVRPSEVDRLTSRELAVNSGDASRQQRGVSLDDRPYCTVVQHKDPTSIAGM